MTQKADALKQLDNLRSVENGDIHWGAAVMLSKECPRCGLRLSHPNHHITVFSCGKGVNYLVRMSNDVMESEYLKSCLLSVKNSLDQLILFKPVIFKNVLYEACVR